MPCEPMMPQGISPMSVTMGLSTLCARPLALEGRFHHSDFMTLLSSPNQATLTRPRFGPSWVPVVPPNPHSPLAQPALPACASAPSVPPQRGPHFRLRAIAVPSAVALVETISGQRSLQQLDDCASREVRALIARLRSRHQANALRLRSLRVQASSPGHIEVSLHLSYAGRSRAAAAQLSYQDGRWVTTAFAIALDRETFVS